MKIKVIYNPHAGSKRKLKKSISLHDIQTLMTQYQLPADYYTTKGSGDASRIARQCVLQKYTHVLVAGGDGTVSEVASELIHTDLVMGILPVGSFMNVARMLSIPLDLEKAIMLLKIGKTRKIDVGKIVEINGQVTKAPNYFLESSGVGMEAELQKEFELLEKGDLGQIRNIIRTVMDYYLIKFEIHLDEKIITTRASLVEISNGPWTGLSFNLAPDAKLNDHRLTISIFHMQKWELLIFLLKMLGRNPVRSTKIERHQCQYLRVQTRRPRLVQANAREIGLTPVAYTLVPNALNVITGFQVSDAKTSLRPRTTLDV